MCTIRQAVKVVAVMVTMLACSSAGATTFLFEDVPYLSRADSPFDLAAPGMFLEDFEAGITTAGWSANDGGLVGPSSYTDSVDGDDGAIDGSGNGGSIWNVGFVDALIFTFNPSTFGQLPTQAGIVLTDINPVYADVLFEAFDAQGASLGTIGPVYFGDGNYYGGTDEDRFFGVIHEGGISAIAIGGATEQLSMDADHLQFYVPEPASLATIALLALVGLRRPR